MKLIPAISRRSLTTVTASLALLLPLSASTARPAAAVTVAGQATGPSCPWLNQSLPVAARVRLLLSKMTLANEITMVEGQAAGPGTNVVYQQGLPTDTSLPAIPASALSPAYAPTPVATPAR